MKTENRTVVTPEKKVTTSTNYTDAGKATSQTIISQEIKSGKVTVERVGGGKLLP